MSEIVSLRERLKAIADTTNKEAEIKADQERKEKIEKINRVLELRAQAGNYEYATDIEEWLDPTIAAYYRENGLTVIFTPGRAMTIKWRD